MSNRQGGKWQPNANAQRTSQEREMTRRRDNNNNYYFTLGFDLDLEDVGMLALATANEMWDRGNRIATQSQILYGMRCE